MRKIHKLALNPYTERYQMPIGARILHVSWQHADVYIWYEFDTGAPMEERSIKVVPTGLEFDPGGLNYIGSAVANDLVFHVYC